MPKITAPTVAQHRTMVQCRLIDAIEEIIRSDKPEKLAAGAVTTAAGIVRSSICRYVDSVDDLRGLVLARHLPAWIGAVAAELETIEAPTERIVMWVRADPQQTTHTGYGRLMGLSRSIMPSPAIAKAMDNSHTVMRDSIAQAQAILAQDPIQLRAATGLTRGLLEAGFRQLDSGIPVDVVVGLGGKVARGLVAGITGGNS